MSNTISKKLMYCDQEIDLNIVSFLKDTNLRPSLRVAILNRNRGVVN